MYSVGTKVSRFQDIRVNPRPNVYPIFRKNILLENCFRPIRSYCLNFPKLVLWRGNADGKGYGIELSPKTTLNAPRVFHFLDPLKAKLKMRMILYGRQFTLKATTSWLKKKKE